MWRHGRRLSRGIVRRSKWSILRQRLCPSQKATGEYLGSAISSVRFLTADFRDQALNLLAKECKHGVTPSTRKEAGEQHGILVVFKLHKGKITQLMHSDNLSN